MEPYIASDPNLNYLADLYEQGQYSHCLTAIGETLYQRALLPLQPSVSSGFSAAQLFAMGQTTGKIHSKGMVHGTLLLENFSKNGSIKNFGQTRFLSEDRADQERKFEAASQEPDKIKEFIEQQVAEALRKNASPGPDHIPELANDLITLRFQMNEAEWELFSAGYATTASPETGSSVLAETAELFETLPCADLADDGPQRMDFVPAYLITLLKAQKEELVPLLEQELDYLCARRPGKEEYLQIVLFIFKTQQTFSKFRDFLLDFVLQTFEELNADKEFNAVTELYMQVAEPVESSVDPEWFGQCRHYAFMAAAETSDPQYKSEFLLEAAKCITERMEIAWTDQAFQALLRGLLAPASADVAGESFYLLLKAAFKLFGHTGDTKYLQVANYFVLSPAMPQPFFDLVSAYKFFFASITEKKPVVKQDLLEKTLKLVQANEQLTDIHSFVLLDLQQLTTPSASDDVLFFNAAPAEAINFFKKQRPLETIRVLLRDMEEPPRVAPERSLIRLMSSLSLLALSALQAMDYYLNERGQLEQILIYLETKYGHEIMAAPLSESDGRYQANAAGNLGWALARFTPQIAQGIALLTFSMTQTDKSLQPGSFSARANNLAMSYMSLAENDNDSESAKVLLLKAVSYMEEVVEYDQELSGSADPATFAISETLYLDHYNLGLIYYALATRTYDSQMISHKSATSADYYRKTIQSLEKSAELSERGRHFSLLGTVDNLIAKVHLDLVETLFYEKHWAGEDIQLALYNWYRQVLGGHFSTKNFVRKGLMKALEHAERGLQHSIETDTPMLAVEVINTITRIWSILKHQRHELVKTDYGNMLLGITNTLEQIRDKGWVATYAQDMSWVGGLIDLWKSLLSIEALGSLFPIKPAAVRDTLAALTAKNGMEVVSRLAADQLAWFSFDSDEQGLLVNGLQLKKRPDGLTLRIPSQNLSVEVAGLQADQPEFGIRNKQWVIDRSLETFARMEAHLDLDILPDHILTLCCSGRLQQSAFSLECFQMPSKIWDSWTCFLNLDGPANLQLSLEYIGKYTLSDKRLSTIIPESINAQDELLIFGSPGITMEVYLPYFAAPGDKISVKKQNDRIVLIPDCKALVLTLKTTPKVSFGDVLLLMQKDLPLGPLSCSASLELLSAESAFPKPTAHTFYPLYFFEDTIPASLVEQVRSRRSLLKLIAGMPGNTNSFINLLEVCFDPKGELYLFVTEQEQKRAMDAVAQAIERLSDHHKNYYMLKSAASRELVMAVYHFEPFEHIHIIACDDSETCTCVQMVLDLASIRHHRPESVPFFDGGSPSFSNFKGNVIGNLLNRTALGRIITTEELFNRYCHLLAEGTGKTILSRDGLQAGILANSAPMIPRRPVILLSADVGENMGMIPWIRQQEAIVMIYKDDTIIARIKQIAAGTIYAAEALKGKLAKFAAIDIHYLPGSAEDMTLYFVNGTRKNYEDFMHSLKNTHPHLLPSLPVFEAMKPESYLITALNHPDEDAWGYLAANYAAAQGVPFYRFELSAISGNVIGDAARLFSGGAAGTPLKICRDYIGYRDQPEECLTLFSQSAYDLLADLRPKYLGWICSRIDIPIELDSKPALSLQYGLGRLGGPDLFTTSQLIEKAALSEDRVHPGSIRALLMDASYADPRKPLPAAQKESAMLREFFEEKEELSVASITSADQADDKTAFLQAIISSQLIHFAGHGVYNDLQASAGLYFRSGPLFSDKLLSQLTQHPLVFINACNSGAVSQDLSGFQGLSAKFITNGAINYLGSMWPVLDQDSYTLAVSFYREALNGESVGLALKNARVAVSTEDEETWAAYVLFGCPRNGFYRLADRNAD